MSTGRLPAGIMTATVARDGGWTYDDLARQVKRSHLNRLTPGAYLPAERWDALDAIAQHLATAQALLLTRDIPWALARRTAAAAHGLDVLEPLPGQPQLVRPPTTGQKASTSFERVSKLPRAHQVELQGLRVTSVARTVVDLARELTFREAVVVADSALRLGAHPEELAQVLAFCDGWPGARRARAVLAFADGRAETPLESISRVGLRACRLPSYEPQVEVWVGGRLVARVDGLWREWGVVGEADGKLKYTSPAALHAEKVRQDELDDLGLTIARWGWDEAWHPEGRLDVRVRRARARAEGRKIDPRVTFVSTTLEQAQARARASAARAA